jgi:hypothetical protein
VFPLPPIVAAGLVAVAALLATRLQLPTFITRALGWGKSVAPLGWFLLGAILGPGLGLVDHTLLEACAPILAIATGWVAARAGAELATREAPASWSWAHVLDAAAALLLPAALLGAAVLGQLTPTQQEWRVLGPTVLTMTAAAALAGSGNAARLTPISLAVAVAALVAMLLPHTTVADAKRLVLATGYTIGGAWLCTALAARLARRGALLPGTIAALILAAGIGYVMRLSPLVVCAVLGFALVRRSAPHARLAAELRLHEPVAVAVLWTLVGAGVSGPLVPVALATALFALWPIGRRLIGGPADLDATLGLAIAANFAMTAGPVLGEWGRAVPTVAALGLLLVRIMPDIRWRTAERLTSPAARIEVSA